MVCRSTSPAETEWKTPTSFDSVDVENFSLAFSILTLHLSFTVTTYIITYDTGRVIERREES